MEVLFLYFFVFFVIERCNLLFLGYLLPFNLPRFYSASVSDFLFPQNDFQQSPENEALSELVTSAKVITEQEFL